LVWSDRPKICPDFSNIFMCLIIYQEKEVSVKLNMAMIEWVSQGEESARYHVGENGGTSEPPPIARGGRHGPTNNSSNLGEVRIG
jgi:hypothetical protein